MELYIKNKKGQLEETNLKSVLELALSKADFRIDNGAWHDENHQWIEIKQRSKKPSEVTVTISFDLDGNKLHEIQVHESEILEVIDDENMKCII